jgi:flagellar hook-length control protein FliK
MEVAPNETDMVSLASIEDSVLSPLAPARDPLVTSSNRFSVAAALSERSAITAISASSGEGGNSASLQGNPNLASPQHTAASKSEATATVLKNFAAELEKFRQSGQSQVQLELNVSENDTVKVRLQMRGDELRSTFITDSPELRDALQKAWPEFAQSSRDRGFRFGDPSFQNAYSQNESSSQGRQGARDREANSEFAIPAKSTTSPRRAVTPAAARPALWA